MNIGSKKNIKKQSTKAILAFLILFLISFSVSAQNKVETPASNTILSNPVFIALSIIIAVLAVIIAVFGELVKTAAYHKVKQDKAKKETTSSVIKTIVLVIALSSFSSSLLAQNTEVIVKEVNTYWGLGAFTFYFMLSVIIFEIIVAASLYNMAMKLLGVEERKLIEAAEKAKQKAIVKAPSLIEKINASVSIEKEADIMLDHNYDGIRELDNDLPPWWKYGFYLTIIISIVYLIHYHVSHTGKSQLAEYEDQLIQAKHEMEEFRKKSANLVDENNATLLTDKESIASGKTIFIDNCAACHGKQGEGSVGPNLTDDYWLYNGGVKDIFRTIKFGKPEKGMKAWQQDLGAKQIHEVSSYIKSLRGTNPANAKEKQGELYIEENNTDSTQVASKDSVQIVLKEK